MQLLTMIACWLYKLEGTVVVNVTEGRTTYIGINYSCCRVVFLCVPECAQTHLHNTLVREVVVMCKLTCKVQISDVDC